tara:strand:+ start:304 stop:912 length:609 start_codon:yes stop_codon:yes gene_type:complete
MDKNSTYYNLGITIKQIKNKKYVKFTTILYLVLHVSIIIIFEIFFYFLYIIKKEYELFDYLIDDITNNDYYQLNDTTKIIINDFLRNMTNLNYINSRSIEDRNDRMNTKTKLFNNSLIIVTFFSLLSTFIVVFGLYYKKIKLRYLILDLLTILCMISMFEYIFFTNIISRIKPISPYELLNSVITRILDNYFNNNGLSLIEI